MNDRAKELIFEHIKGQAQFAYFQLGAAASAIAFAIHETEGHSLKATPWPIGAAVFAWGISFVAGCLGVEAHQRGIRSNARYLIATQGSERLPLDHELQDVLGQAKKIVEDDLARPVLRFRIQLWTLFLGAAFYVGGQVMQMAAVDRAERPAQIRKP